MTRFKFKKKTLVVVWRTDSIQEVENMERLEVDKLVEGLLQ